MALVISRPTEPIAFTEMMDGLRPRAFQPVLMACTDSWGPTHRYACSYPPCVGAIWFLGQFNALDDLSYRRSWRSRAPRYYSNGALPLSHRKLSSSTSSAQHSINARVAQNMATMATTPRTFSAESSPFTLHPSHSIKKSPKRHFLKNT